MDHQQKDFKGQAGWCFKCWSASRHFQPGECPCRVGAFSVIVKTLWTFVDWVVSGLSVCCELPSVDRGWPLVHRTRTRYRHWPRCSQWVSWALQREGCYNITLSWPRTHLSTVCSITLILPHLHSQHVDTHRHRTLSCQLAHICDIGSFTAELNRWSENWTRHNCRIWG